MNQEEYCCAVVQTLIWCAGVRGFIPIAFFAQNINPLVFSLDLVHRIFWVINLCPHERSSLQPQVKE